MNYVLKRLLASKPFMYDIHDCEHFKLCASHRLGFCIICSLDNIFMSLVNYTSQALYVHEFVRYITLFYSSFLLFKQEDAYEFLFGVLNLLEMKFDGLKKISGYKPYLLINPSKDFLCSTINFLSCSNCSHTSSQSETWYGLSLGITTKMSLTSALSFFTKAGEFSDISCDACNQRVNAENKILLEKIAPFLIF
ncbi:UCH domain-containing protein [Cephalotus follicularis]|uniref:UCH domain-containing protein n=1 Tax=Cephalotus follicularis TaxID=3775 RepID=A0A1Q3D887_CEPFO|nr:UCH domain-containing protein [Cephalotus follicularis]